MTFSVVAVQKVFVEETSRIRFRYQIIAKQHVLILNSACNVDLITEVIRVAHPTSLATQYRIMQDIFSCKYSLRT